jgi:hypothetical protein
MLTFNFFVKYTTNIRTLQAFYACKCAVFRSFLKILSFKTPFQYRLALMRRAAVSPQKLCFCGGPLSFNRFAASELPQIVAADCGRAAEAA